MDPRPLVVIARHTDPIDLTASLLLSRLRQSKGKARPEIIWVADGESTSRSLMTSLEALARPLAAHFSIKVMSYRQAWLVSGLDGPAGLLASIRRLITEKSGQPTNRIRIHRGAVWLSSHREVVQARCLEFGKRPASGFDASVSGRLGTWRHYDWSDIVGVAGSLHLYLAEALGEIPHLPWYCLDDNKLSIQVEETITPIACTAQARSGSAGMFRLKPTGYSALDYLCPRFSQTQRPIAPQARAGMLRAWGWLLDDYPPSANKIIGVARGAPTLIERRYSTLRQELLSGVRRASITDKYLPTDDHYVIDRLLEVAVMSRALEFFDRSRNDQISADYRGLLKSAGLDPARRAASLDAVHYWINCEIDIMNDLLRQLDCDQYIDHLGRVDRFGCYAKKSIELASHFAAIVISILAGHLKATVPRLLSDQDSDALVTGFDRVLTERGTEVSLLTSGTVLAYDD